MLRPIPKKTIKLSAVVLLYALSIAAIRAQDLKPEEILARHMDSIGAKEKRDAVKNRMVLGTSEFASKLPSRKTAGKGIIVSEPNNLFFVTSFASQEYPFEKIGYFGNKISLPFITAGTRSPLGAFINDHNKILSEGLFTGSISSTWNLLDPQKKGKFTSGGTKKIDGRKTYLLNYYSGDSSTEFTVKMYFDAETFQHVRTEYRHTIAGKQATFGVLGETSGVEIAMTEEFADFKDENGLTLPHLYKIKYLTSSSSGTYEYNWGLNILQYLFNQKLAPDFFTFDIK